jgi:hypothetical protein
MSVPETSAPRRISWPADYYSGPSPQAVLPRGVTYGCGAASVVVLILVFAGGAFLSSGGMVDFMDLVFGMTMGEIRGMYTNDVTEPQKKELEASIESLRKSVRERKVAVGKLDPVLQTMRKTMSDTKLNPAEVQQVTAAARKANQPH